MAESQRTGRQSDAQQTPAEASQPAGEVTQTPEDAPAGVSSGQVKRMSERPKAELREAAVFKADLKRGADKQPDHVNDQTSYPGPEIPPLERPPFTTTRPDVPIVQSALLGANEHMPPDPDEFDAAGRPRDAGERNS